jgi:hypothetical protein
VGDKSVTNIIAVHENGYRYEDPIPVFELSGALDFELRNLHFVPERPDLESETPARVVNRSALAVDGGAEVRLQHVAIETKKPAIGASQSTPATKTGKMFYGGISVTDGTIVLYKSAVHTFARAIEGRRSRLAIVGDRIVSPEKSVVATLPFDDIDYSELVDLRGRSLAGNYQAFAAIHLHDRDSQGFLAGIRISSPVGLIWGSPHSPPEFLEDDYDDLVSWFTEIAWDVDDSRPFFTRGSLALMASSNGHLRFSATDIRGMGNLLECYAEATVKFIDAPWFCNISKTPPFTSCDVELQYAYIPDTCYDLEL